MLVPETTTHEAVLTAVKQAKPAEPGKRRTVRCVPRQEHSRRTEERGLRLHLSPRGANADRRGSERRARQVWSSSSSKACTPWCARRREHATELTHAKAAQQRAHSTTLRAHHAKAKSPSHHGGRPTKCAEQYSQPSLIAKRLGVRALLRRFPRPRLVGLKRNFAVEMPQLLRRGGLTRLTRDGCRTNASADGTGGGAGQGRAATHAPAAKRPTDSCGLLG